MSSPSPSSLPGVPHQTSVFHKSSKLLEGSKLSPRLSASLLMIMGRPEGAGASAFSSKAAVTARRSKG